MLAFEHPTRRRPRAVRPGFEDRDRPATGPVRVILDEYEVMAVDLNGERVRQVTARGVWQRAALRGDARPSIAGAPRQTTRHDAKPCGSWPPPPYRRARSVANGDRRWRHVSRFAEAVLSRDEPAVPLEPAQECSTRRALVHAAAFRVRVSDSGSARAEPCAITRVQPSSSLQRLRSRCRCPGEAPRSGSTRW